MRCPGDSVTEGRFGRPNLTSGRSTYFDLPLFLSSPIPPCTPLPYAQILGLFPCSLLFRGLPFRLWRESPSIWSSLPFPFLSSERFLFFGPHLWLRILFLALLRLGPGVPLGLSPPPRTGAFPAFGPLFCTRRNVVVKVLWSNH